MGQDFTPGSRWHSVACDTEVIIVRIPTEPVSLECGGHPVIATAEWVPATIAPDPAHTTGTAIGKRYADEVSGLEVLCTKSGGGSLSLDGVVLPVKDAKLLPSSD